jgi:hypothetical protein
VHLDAVGLVLETAVAAFRRKLARIVAAGDVDRARREASGRRRDRVRPLRDLVVVRIAARVTGVRKQAHLPHGLLARSRVDADGDLDEIGILERGNFALPDVEVREVRPAAGQRVRRRPVRLLVVRRVAGARALGEQRVEAVRGVAVVLREQAVDVHPPAADRQLAG